jgi:hypothetical protein
MSGQVLYRYKYPKRMLNEDNIRESRPSSRVSAIAVSTSANIGKHDDKMAHLTQGLLLGVFSTRWGSYSLTFSIWAYGNTFKASSDADVDDKLVLAAEPTGLVHMLLRLCSSVNLACSSFFAMYVQYPDDLNAVNSQNIHLGSHLYSPKTKQNLRALIRPMPTRRYSALSSSSIR